MPRYRFAWLAAVLAIVLGGCASGPQVVSLQPNVSVPASAPAGQNRAVAVTVVDQRGHTRLLGYRASSSADLNKAILNDKDVSRVVYEGLAQALRQEGFVPSHGGSGGNGAALTVRIKTLKYRQVGTKVAPVGRTTVELAAKAGNGGHSYSATYRVRDEDPLSLIHSRSETQRVINKALDKALGQVMDDNGITKVLSGQSAQ